MRALAVAQVANQELQDSIHINGPHVLHTTADGHEVQAIDYAFDLTTYDFGLSKFDGLVFGSRGSCYTEYGWYKGVAEGSNAEVYLVNFGNGGNSTRIEVSNNGWAPLATFTFGDQIDSPAGRNRTFAIFVSSFDRWSISLSTDPLYETRVVNASDPDNVQHQVLRGRPALNCWTLSSWRYKGHEPVGTWRLPEIPGLGVTEIWRDAFWELVEISPANVGQYLDSIALASSQKKGMCGFDGDACSWGEDLRRLVLTTRVYMANLLINTTLYNSSLAFGENTNSEAKGYTMKGYTNLLKTQEQKDELASFVVKAGENVSTLDVKFLIAVPLAQLLLFAITYLIRYRAKKKTREWDEQEENS